MSSLAPSEFVTETTYLNTASFGLPAASTLVELDAATARWAAGRGGATMADEHVEPLREAFARLIVGASADDIGIGNTAAGMLGPVVAALPPGAEVLIPEGEFTSVSLPFVHRGDLTVRFAPLHQLAEEVRPETALVALSVVQSADGRVTDLSALRAATRAADAELLVDATQAAGWLPLRFADADYWVCATFKWLIGARSVAFFAVSPERAHRIRPVSPGWYATEDRWSQLYHPGALADSARRFDTTPDWSGVVTARSGLRLIEDLTVDAIHAHDLALAERFRTGLTDLGHTPVPGDSAIVSVPGTIEAEERLRAADIVAAARGGALRFAFHLYNSADDVDRALRVLGARVSPIPRRGCWTRGSSRHRVGRGR
ncbi:aminotransferase class V-fold PLP-dependent enzyme [Nocardia sp. NEAU-351]|uniref:Aminotransferase class V-fold PLP-dependent enzyme n=1 Tax=Nocardia bovistercoris TaxID=2785916 RepID=A0A931IAN5_9NOCA|nr:aminotransferase class V-fold PLP-dependent enzyme [Nocardia bovistercoris]